MLSFDEFKKVELVVGDILKVEDHPDADRLYVITVDVGSCVKTLVAGIRDHYTKENLIGRQVIVVNNLEPACIRGVESSGMILCASSEESLSIISPEKKSTPGTRIK